MSEMTSDSLVRVRKTDDVLAGSLSHVGARFRTKITIENCADKEKQTRQFDKVVASLDAPSRFGCFVMYK